MAFTTVSVVRSSESVVRQIEARVRAGTLARGQKLPSERELSEQFGVSRGIVREAIKLLEGGGVLESRHGSGVYVKADSTPFSVSRALTFSVTPDEESVAALFAFRAEVETVAAHWAATHIATVKAQLLCDALAANCDAIARADWDAFSETDAYLHGVIAQVAGNPYLAAVLGTTRQMQRDVVRRFMRHAGAFSVAQRQHEQIVAAILAGDADGAARAMRAHIHYTAGSVQEALEASLVPPVATTARVPAKEGDRMTGNEAAP